MTILSYFLVIKSITLHPTSSYFSNASLSLAVKLAMSEQRCYKQGVQCIMRKYGNKFRLVVSWQYCRHLIDVVCAGVMIAKITLILILPVILILI